MVEVDSRKPDGPIRAVARERQARVLSCVHHCQARVRMVHRAFLACLNSPALGFCTVGAALHGDDCGTSMTFFQFFLSSDLFLTRISLCITRRRRRRISKRCRCARYILSCLSEKSSPFCCSTPALVHAATAITHHQTTSANGR